MNVWEILLRIVISIVIGGIIGYERENKNRPAGFRTHILVCLGAAVISMMQIYDMEYVAAMIKANSELAPAMKSDVGRLGAQVISGIGFLGAGTIIHEKGSVKGLTTAASLWAVACIGLAIGSGYYYLSVLSAISVVIVLVSLKRLEERFRVRLNSVQFQIDYTDKEKIVQDLSDYFKKKNIKIKNIEFFDEEEKNECRSSLYTLVIPRCMNRETIIEDLKEKEEIVKIDIV